MSSRVDLFNEIASRYDITNTIISCGLVKYWRSLFTRCVTSWSFPNPILDIACGSGESLKILLDLFPAQKVVGIDYASKMLFQAQRKFQRYPQLSLICGDALDLPIRSNTIGGVTVVWGLRNLTHHLERGLSEIYRVLVPKGRFMFIEFFPLNPSLYASLVRLWIRFAVPRIGKILTGTQIPYEYFYNTLKNFCTPHEFQNILTKMKFKVQLHHQSVDRLVHLYEGYKEG